MGKISLAGRLPGTGLLSPDTPTATCPVLIAQVVASLCAPHCWELSHILSEYGRMTDAERDQIDQDAQTFMRTCSEAIQQLRNQAHKETHSQQVREHRSAILDFTQDYLRSLHTVQHIEPYQLGLGVKSRFPGTSHGPDCKSAEVSSLRLLW
ncbi:Syntaxin-18 [Myotis davidii]|uniref:Syntaxin-18 n=1 Tax=Myotis davidii TaxID=225400 RepID=L5LQ37_MYODS|nr:Syntaxin-18 [Myotis davidii]